MNAQLRFRLTREAALALVVSSAFSAGAGAAQQVARVQFASGQVTATGTDGRPRTLSRGAEVAVGDTVNTEQGRAQLQFTDGAVVSLQPRTAFRIDDFQFAGKPDGNEKGFFSLLRGGLRTVTGLIGRSNRDAYRVTTSTATIGIRGTEYLAEVGNSLRVAVGGGSIAIANEAGTFVIQQGQAAYVADSKSLPVITFEKPVLPPPSTTRSGGTGEQDKTDPPKTVVAGEREDKPPVTIVVEPPPPPPPPPPTTTITGLGAFALDASLFLAAGSATLNASNQATAFVESGGGQSFTAGTATVSEAAYDGIVGVGRWSSGTATAVVEGEGLQTVTLTLGPNQGAHYAIGAPTLTALPTNVVGTYNLLAATSPTAADGSLGLGTLSPGAGAGQPILAVDFLSGRVGADLSVVFSTRSYRATTTGGVANPATSEVRLLGPLMVNVASIPTSGTGGDACTGGRTCSTDLLGFLAGDGASRAAFSYEIHDDVAIHGAATATQGALAPFTVFPSVAGAFEYDRFLVGATGSATVDGSNNLVRFTHTSGAETYTRGSAIVSEGAYDGTIGVGRWNSGIYTATVGSQTADVIAGPNQGLHYVFGMPTATLPTSAIATYSVLSATRATASDGSLGLGTLSSPAGTGQPILAVDFGSAKIGMDFAVDFSGRGYRVTTHGGLGNPAMSEVSITGPGALFGNTAAILTSGTGGACLVSGGCTTDVKGLFAGTGAERVGFGYKILDGSLGSADIQGAVATAQSGTISPLTAGAVFAWGDGISYSFEPFMSTGAGVAQVRSPGGQLAAFAGPTAGCCGPLSFLPGTASYAQSGFDGTVGFGRLSGGTATIDGGEGSSPLNLSSTQGLHYAFGVHTPTLPVSGVATFALQNATQATSDSGSLGLGTFSGGLAVDFASGKVGVDFTVNFPSVVYRSVSAGGLSNLRGSNVNLSPTSPFTGFNPRFSSSSLTTTRDGSSCSSGCFTYVSGFFAGTGAVRSGLGYVIDDNDGSQTVFGAATFTQSGLTPAAPSALVGFSLPLNYALANDFAGGVSSSNAFGYPGTTGTIDSSGALIEVRDPSSLLTIGSAVPVETGNDGTIGWTRWKNGTLGGFSSGRSGATLTGENSFHNVYGTPTPLGDMTALQTGAVTATYNLIGATTPTSEAGGGTAGMLNSASLAVRFGPGQVDFNADITHSATNYVVTANNLPIAGTGGVGSPVTGSSFGGSGVFTSSANCCTGCSTTVQGFFAGAQAVRAGAAYSILNDSGTRVNGVAAFNKVTP